MVVYNATQRTRIPKIVLRDPNEFLAWAESQNVSEQNKQKLLNRVVYALAWE